MQCVSRVKARSWEPPVLMLFDYETLGTKIMPRCWDKNEMNIACYGFGCSVHLPKKAALMRRGVTKYYCKDKLPLFGRAYFRMCMWKPNVRSSQRIKTAEFRDLCSKIQEQSVTVF